MEDLSRRDFLKQATAVAAAILLPKWSQIERIPEYLRDLLLYRELPNFTESVEAQMPFPAEVTRSIMGLPEHMRLGGPVQPDQTLFNNLGARKVLTVNLVDGTTALYVRDENNNLINEPISANRDYAFAILGRELIAEPSATQVYAESQYSLDGSAYNGPYGVLWSADGVPRTLYTPGLIAEYRGAGYVDNFGGIGGTTDTAYILRKYSDGFSIRNYDLNSPYTIHRVPEGALTDQSIALRETDLGEANREGIPVPYPTLNRSSGCVNYDQETWNYIKAALNGYQDGSVIIMLTYPELNQELLLNQNPNYSSDPLAYVNIYGPNRTWPYYDIRNRRQYFHPLNPNHLGVIRQYYFGPDRDDLIARIMANQAGEQ